MSAKSSLPQVSRIAFFKSIGEDVIHTIAGAIYDFATGGGKLSASQLAVYVWNRVLVEVPNGGFVQFFYNRRGDAGVAELCRIFESLEQPKIVKLLESAAAVYHEHKDAFKVKNP